MTFRQDMYFTYDGIRSDHMGLVNVSVGGGLYEESFTANKDIIEEKIMGNENPYFYGVAREPLEFDLSFAFKDQWDERRINDVAMWLAQDTYKPLIFSKNDHKIFYCLPVSDFSIIHNGLKQGYLNLKMRCKSPYIYTPEQRTPTYDFSSNDTNGREILFENKGHVECKPTVYIKTIGGGDISIVNYSDGAKEFKFTGLASDETITVDNETEDITTDITGLYRYDNFNMNFLSLPHGVNRLRVFGNCILYFKHYFKLKH